MLKKKRAHLLLISRLTWSSIYLDHCPKTNMWQPQTSCVVFQFLMLLGMFQCRLLFHLAKLCARFRSTGHLSFVDFHYQPSAKWEEYWNQWNIVQLLQIWPHAAPWTTSLSNEHIPQAEYNHEREGALQLIVQNSLSSLPCLTIVSTGCLANRRQLLPANLPTKLSSRSQVQQHLASRYCTIQMLQW